MFKHIILYYVYNLSQNYLEIKSDTLKIIIVGNLWNLKVMYKGII